MTKEKTRELRRLTAQIYCALRTDPRVEYSNLKTYHTVAVMEAYDLQDFLDAQEKEARGVQMFLNEQEKKPVDPVEEVMSQVGSGERCENICYSCGQEIKG